jgi:hypothetical protein
MKLPQWLGLLMLVFIPVVVVGCGSGTTGKQTKGDDEVKAALAKLKPEDRRLAEAQKRCPISKELLGSMGVPDKVKIDHETVFLCCDGCREDALADPAKTLATVKELKAKASAEK